MPFTQISLRAGKSPAYHKALMEGIYTAMRDAIGIPENDRFATITEHSPSCFNTSGDYLGVDRSDELVMIQITLLAGRPVEKKQALYAAIARELAKDPGVRKEDIFVNLVEVAKQDWSLGNGVAQYV
ncbi:tautomerase family protein [uncultured Tateyamaria sp.]|uniref:tautomerase family protein n=1 Tax=uncultured Tateyamaria sp. TaxID=455651 RepID=UPI0026209C32|nr:tautomerase family protein [uncultured Tateyamaria sp.]